MVLCMIVGCSNRSGRDNGVYFARVPSVVTNQGKEAENCLEKGDHAGFRRLVEMILQTTFWRTTVFVEDTLFNVDWVPTLCLGHSKKAVGPKNLEKAAERSQRARDREQIKRPAQEQREKELEAERTAKRINLSEPSHQIADVNFIFDDQIEETPNEKGIQTEKVVCKETGIQSEEYDYLFTPLKDH